MQAARVYPVGLMCPGHIDLAVHILIQIHKHTVAISRHYRKIAGVLTYLPAQISEWKKRLYVAWHGCLVFPVVLGGTLVLAVLWDTELQGYLPSLRRPRVSTRVLSAVSSVRWALQLNAFL